MNKVQRARLTEILSLKKEVTRLNYDQALRAWGLLFPDLAITKATESHARRFVLFEQERGTSQGTLLNRLRSFSYIRDHLTPSENPFPFVIRQANLHRGDIHRLTPAVDASQVRAIMELAAKSHQPERDGALMAISFGCALRRSELINLNVEDVVLGDKAYLLIHKTKSQKFVEQVIPAWGVAHVQALVTKRKAEGAEPNDPLFIIYSRVRKKQDCRMGYNTWARLFKSYTARTGRKLSPHSARVTAITRILDKGANVFLAQAYARHRTPVATSRYYRYNTANLIEAADKIDY